MPRWSAGRRWGLVAGALFLVTDGAQNIRAAKADSQHPHKGLLVAVSGEPSFSRPWGAADEGTK
jgi:hypothetical protein